LTGALTGRRPRSSLPTGEYTDVGPSPADDVRRAGPAADRRRATAPRLEKLRASATDIRLIGRRGANHGWWTRGRRALGMADRAKEGHDSRSCGAGGGGLSATEKGIVRWVGLLGDMSTPSWGTRRPAWWVGNTSLQGYTYDDRTAAVHGANGGNGDDSRNTVPTWRNGDQRRAARRSQTRVMQFVGSDDDGVGSRIVTGSGDSFCVRAGRPSRDGAGSKRAPSAGSSWAISDESNSFESGLEIWKARRLARRSTVTASGYGLTRGLSVRTCCSRADRCAIRLPEGYASAGRRSRCVGLPDRVGPCSTRLESFSPATASNRPADGAGDRTRAPSSCPGAPISRRGRNVSRPGGCGQGAPLARAAAG